MNNKTCGECCHLEKMEHFSYQCKHCNGTVSTSNTACNHFSKQYGICPECGSYLFSYEHTEDNDWQLCTCERCGCSGTPEEFLYNSVFARITQNLEVLARSLCGKIRIGCLSGYYSMLTGRYYPDMEKAVADTIKKLKKVTK